MANEYSLIEDLLRRIRAGQFNEPTQMGSMVGMRAQPNFNIPPDAYTEARNQKFSERAAPLDIQPPQYEEDVPMPPRRTTEFRTQAPMPVPRPAEAAPSMPENVSRALWAVYNETGNPADFERANAAQRMGRAEGGFVPEAEQNAQLNDAVTYARNLAREEAMGEAKQALGETWPAQAVKSAYSAVTAPRDAYEGKLNPYSEEGIKRAIDMAGMIMTGGVGGAPAGAIGSGPIRSTAAEVEAEALKLAREAQIKRVKQYSDAPTRRIDDWQWRPMTDVAKDLDLQKIPPHVQAFGDYMRDMSVKAANEGLSARDLIKGYTTTRASIQRRSQDADKIRALGLDIPLDVKTIRPEGAWSEWLMTPTGKQYLDQAVRGNLDANSVENAMKIMQPFGKQNEIPSFMDWAAKNLPGREQSASDLVARAAQGASSPQEWRNFTSDVRGVGPSKSGFLASLYGRGDQPTLDARQVIMNTGAPTKEAGRYIARGGGEGGVEAVDRLAARQRALALEVPSKYDPFYQHLAHHAIWDKASNELTTHGDIIRSMQKSGGGSVHGYATDGYVDPMGAAYEPAGEAPEPEWYKKAADAAARATSAVAEPFMSGTAESAREGLNLMRGEPGRAPISAAWQYPLGVAGFLTSPIMGAGRAVKDVTTQLSGSPEIGARAGFMTEMGNPAKIGPALAAVAPMASRAAEAARATQIARELSPLGFYSHGAEAAAALPQAKGTPEQYAAMLQKAGVKPAELEHTGFQQAFAGRPSVTREEIAKHFQEKMPQVEETVLGGRPKHEKRRDELAALGNNRSPSEDSELMAIYAGDYPSSVAPTKFQQYTLPGGENYREVLLKSQQPYKALEPEIKALGLDVNTASPRDIERAGGSPDLVERFTAAMPSSSNEYRSSHWDDPNVLAHLRMADRTGPNGEKVLHIEEIQSDWGQAGRKEGFVTQYKPEDIKPMDPANITSERRRNEFWNFATPTGAIDIPRNDRWPTMEAARQHILDKVKPTGVPTAPYVTSTQGWTDLALKRALREAAEGGYDKMVWTPGAEQAKRYDLSKQISNIEYHEPSGIFNAYDSRGRKVMSNSYKPDQIADVVGKDVAEKLLKSEPGDMGVKSLSGQDLSVGGEGMKSYYDKMVPTRMKELLKKLDKDAKLGVSEVNGIQVPSIQITPAMREKILSGQTAFATGGAVVERALGVVSQSKPGRR